MRLSITIALRYLLARKSTQAIHIITWISVVGMAIGTAALILILSVFNGFEHLLSGMLSTFNPDVKITLATGKYISRDSLPYDALTKVPGVASVSMAIEETCFMEYKGSQELGIIKGVDRNFYKVTGLDSSLVYGEVKYSEETSYAILGSGIDHKLAVNANDPFSSMTIYMTSKSTDPLDKGFTSIPIYPTGVFTVGGDIDQQYVITDIESVNSLLDLEDHVSSIEVKVAPSVDENKVVKEISTIMGPRYKVRNRYAQDEAFLRIMNIEKWISYLIACLTLLIIAFNMVGSLWMLVLEKKKDIAILRSMGMTSSGVRGIFTLLGLSITIIGLVVGTVLALILYRLQKKYGIVSIPEGFLIDAYPIQLRALDFVTVTLTVLLIGYLASILPSRRAGQVSQLINAINQND
jgi:lipoprotein-releasing system permease protein